MNLREVPSPGQVQASSSGNKGVDRFWADFEKIKAIPRFY
jgi:hypothetical protein